MRKGGVLLTAMLLAACAAKAPKEAEPLTPSAAPATQEATPVPAPKAAPAPAPEAPVFSIDGFVGQPPQRVSDRFGEPTLRRREGEAEIWQYERGPCVLHFYIYPDEAGGHRVTYAEARTVAGSWGPPPPMAGACLLAFGRVN